jgi:hypothetical protein
MAKAENGSPDLISALPRETRTYLRIYDQARYLLRPGTGHDLELWFRVRLCLLPVHGQSSTGQHSTDDVDQ